MGKLIVISFLTLDGVMQAPGGKDEDPSDGFKYGGWQVPFWGDAEDEALPKDIANAGALLIGRKTYDIFSAYWPTVGKDIQWIGPFMNNTTKYVASKTLQKTDWQNSILLEGDIAEAVAKVKKESRNDIYVFGSGNLCQSLMRHHLIDEYFLKVYPLTLGNGKRLFNPEGPMQNLDLIESKSSKMGVLTLKYKAKS